MVEDLLKDLRKKNGQAYAQFVHDLAHALPVEEIEAILRHAKDIADDSDDDDDDTDVDPRAIAIAEQLDELAEQYRQGKQSIGKKTVGVEVIIKELRK